MDDEIANKVGPAEESLALGVPASLDEMAEQQGVLPVDNLDSISALWPVDDDPDDLLRHILAERAERRQVGVAIPDSTVAKPRSGSEL